MADADEECSGHREYSPINGQPYDSSVGKLCNRNEKNLISKWIQEIDFHGFSG